MDGRRSYYYAAPDSGKPIGPVTLEHLHGLAARGEVRATTMVIREGGEEWEMWRDIYSEQRTREMAGFGLGFLIGVARCLALPWNIVRQSVGAVTAWGASRTGLMRGEAMISATLSKISAPIVVLAWTGWWIGDSICMLVVGRPTMTLTFLGWLANFLMMGISLGGFLGVPSAMAASTARSGVIEALTVHEFGDRLAWMIKIAVFGYFLTIVWALIGEIFAGLASLIRIGRANIGSDKVPNERAAG